MSKLLNFLLSLFLKPKTRNGLCSTDYRSYPFVSLPWARPIAYTSFQLTEQRPKVRIHPKSRLWVFSMYGFPRVRGCASAGRWLRTMVGRRPMGNAACEKSNGLHFLSMKELFLYFLFECGESLKPGWSRESTGLHRHLQDNLAEFPSVRMGTIQKND